MFYKKGVLKNFAHFTEKHPYRVQIKALQFANCVPFFENCDLKLPSSKKIANQVLLIIKYFFLLNCFAFFAHQLTKKANKPILPTDPSPPSEFKIKQFESTNKEEQNKILLLQDIIADLTSIAVCHRHQFSLSQRLRLAFLKRQKGNIQAFRRFKFAKFFAGCVPQIPNGMTHLLSLIQLRALREKQRTVFQSLFRTLM